MAYFKLDLDEQRGIYESLSNKKENEEQRYSLRRVIEIKNDNKS